MKIALIHLSDFHIGLKDKIEDKKIDAIVSSLNSLKKFDECIIVFSGDLAHSGKINEYKKARNVFSKLVRKIKDKFSIEYVKIFLVPGNHDLCLTKDARDRKFIQSYYDCDNIEELLPNEIEYLSNYYEFGYVVKNKYNDILHKTTYDLDGYKIQFNLINTAPFSTLVPNDKELHYFPESQYKYLSKNTNSNLCITVMHHSCEWFNWKYKSNLENEIINNSELLFIGHDHTSFTSSVAINDSLDTCISSAGSIDFSCKNDKDDAFNVIIIDTEKNTLNGYVFKWNTHHNLFTHKLTLNNKKIQNRYSNLAPLPSYVKELKTDEYNLQTDFTKYFVFPKLAIEKFNDYGKTQEIKDYKSLYKLIQDHKKLIISGNTNYGKTTLLKYIYLSMQKNYVPLLWHLESGMKINRNNLIKHLFEEQYGDDSILFEKYQQLDKCKKCILIDGWDLIDEKINLNKLVNLIENEFDIIIYSTSDNSTDVIENIMEEINDDKKIIKLEIKPFYKEKRNELVKNVCLLKNDFLDTDIEKINNIIDNLVQNNSDIFSLNPGFIIKYTNYFIELPFEYSSGESIFSKVFEFELQQSIFAHAKKDDVNEILIKFEELAGYMYDNQTDLLQIGEVTNIIENYNTDYGTNIKTKVILDIGTKTKILKQNDDFSIRFYNKNHLAYFIAKYIIRDEQNEKKSTRGLNFALRNICFGLNADIILFISYILNNMKIIEYISMQAKDLLSEWESISLNELNVGLLNHSITNVTAPTKDDKKQFEEQKEHDEEMFCSDDIVETKGLFEYNENDINEYPYQMIRAMNYTEMICRALPAFYSNMKLTQKRELIDMIYQYPRKIIYSLLNSLDKNAENICDTILFAIKEEAKTKSNGKDYEKSDIMKFLTAYAQGMFLGTLDHFSQLATSNKTITILLENEVTDYCEQFEKLLIIENSRDTDLLLKESLKLINKKIDFITVMVQVIMKKHLLTNSTISFNKKQQIIDTVFGQNNRKLFLLNNNTNAK